MTKKQDSKSPTKTKPIKPVKAQDFLDRQVIFETKRHWFGLFTLYGLTIFGVILIAVFFFRNNNIFSSLLIIGIIAAILAIIFHLIYRVYSSNKITISNIDIQQHIRSALFHKVFSTLNLIDVEDVTYTQNGIFATIFDYGTLNIETAGEQSNFVFIYCPQPDKIRQHITQARIDYLRKSAEYNLNFSD